MMADKMSKEKVPQRGDDENGGLKAVLFGLVLLLVFFAAAVAIPLFSIPEPEVNYVTMANEMNKPEDYDPNKNAAFDYEKAFELVIEEPNKVGEVRRVWPGDMNDKQRETLEGWVEENAEAIKHFERGTHKPYYWSEQKGDFMLEIMMPELKGFKYAAYAAMARARLKAADGDARGGLEDVMACYRAGKHLGGKKTLIEQLVGIAVRAMGVQGAKDILARCETDGDTLVWFGRELAITLSREGGQMDITAERLMFLDVVQRLYTGGLMGDRIMSARAAAKHGVPWSGASPAESPGGL